jgi:Mn-dependent DtxR family transcriptional regulator
MGTNSDRPYAEPMSMNEVEAYLYEAIATLEYIGHPVTRTEIAAVADLDDSTIDRTLKDMADQGFLVQGDYGGELTYELARRDWRVPPDKAQGRVP